MESTGEVAHREASPRRRTLDAAVTLALVAFVLPWSVAPLIGESWIVWTGVAVCGGLLVGAVAVRRVWPLKAFLAASGGMLGLVLLPSIEEGPLALMPMSILYLVSLYSVVSETDLVVVPLVVSGLGALFVLIRLAVDYGNPFQWGAVWALVLVIVLALALSWALGGYRRTWRKYVDSLEERARHAEALRRHEVRVGVARERERVAHEVHDMVAHSLAVVVVQADAALTVLDHDRQAAREMLLNAQRSGREAMDEISGAMAALRDSDHEGGGVRSIQGVTQLVEQLRADGLNVEIESVGVETTMPPETARAAYRIVQESLTNALKHVGPEVRGRVRIEFRSGCLVICVGDDGPGFGTAGSGGLGLIGMKERARQVGGTLRVDSSAAGTTVTAELPTS